MSSSANFGHLKLESKSILCQSGDRNEQNHSDRTGNGTENGYHCKSATNMDFRDNAP